MVSTREIVEAILGRSPYGERGLKPKGKLPSPVAVSRSPYGERGLKLMPAISLATGLSASLPLWGAWIETAP